jgi:hypothetical protein
MFGLLPLARLSGASLCGACQRLLGRRWSPFRRAAVPPRAAGTPRLTIVPETLDELHGPGAGVVELPVRLYWSAGSRSFDLSSPDDAADMYEAVLGSARSRSDVADYLNPSLLVRAWPLLGLSRVKRVAWEERFPVLRGQRPAAAA